MEGEGRRREGGGRNILRNGERRGRSREGEDSEG